MNGYIKLWRKSLKSRVWQNPVLWQLWCYCLLKANHQEAWLTIETGRGKSEVHVLPGQFIFGRFKAAEMLNTKPISTYKRLLKLESMGNLNIKSNNKYSIVTICNWGTYQAGQLPDEHLKEQASNKQVTSKEQASNTNKNVKNDKKVKKYSQNSIEFRLAKLLGDKILLRKPDYQQVLKAEKADWQGWAAHVDRMIRLDSRSADRIEEVILWSQNDHFWQNNILSTDKLRIQYDKLELRMGKNNGTRDNRTHSGENGRYTEQYIR